MGMFDYYVYNCPWCGEEIEDQTKDGPCMLNNYHFGDDPIMDMAMVGTYHCYHCNNPYEIKLVSEPEFVLKKVD